MAAHSDGADEPGSYLDCKSESPSLHHEKEKKETLSSDVSQETDSYKKGISDMMSQLCQLQLNSPHKPLKTNLKMQNCQWRFVQKCAEFMDFITEELQKLNCTIHHVSASDNVIEIDFKQSNSTDDQPSLRAISDIFDRISKKVACRTIQYNPSLISFETFVAEFEHSLDSSKAIAVKGPQTIMIVAKENDIDTVCDQANKTMQLLTDHRGVTESGSNVSRNKNLPVTIIQLEEKQILFLKKCEKGLHYVTQQLQSLAEDCEVDVEGGFLSFVHVDEHEIGKLKNKLSELIVTFKLEPGLYRNVFSIQELDQLLRERLCSQCDMFMVSKEETSHDIIVLCTDSVHAAVESEIKTITDDITEDELVMPTKEQEYFKISGRWNELYNMQDSDLQQKVYFEEITDGDTFTLKIIGTRNKVRNIKTKVKQWLEPQTYSQTYSVSAVKVKLLRKREKAQQYIKQELEKIHAEFHHQNGENSVTLTSDTFEHLEQGYKKFEKLICEEHKCLKQYPILTLNEIKTKVESKFPEKLLIECFLDSKQLLLCGTDDIMPKAMEMLNEITDVCCFQKTVVMDKFRGDSFHTEIHEMIDNLHVQTESCRVSMEEENDKYVFYLIGPRCDILDNEEKIDNFIHSLDKLRFVEYIDIPDSVCQLLKQSEHAKDYVRENLSSSIEFDFEKKLIKSTTEVKSHSEVKSLFDSLFRSDTLLLENKLIHLLDVNELRDVLTDILNDVYKLEKYKGKFLISCPTTDRLHICAASDIFDDCLNTLKEMCKYTDQTELGPITEMEYLKQKLDHLKSDLPQQVRILLKTDSDLLRIIILGPKAEIEKAKNQFNLVDLEYQPKHENKVVKLSPLKVRFLKSKDTALSYILKTLESKQTKCQFDLEKGIIIFTECKSAEESEQMLDEIIVEHEENISEKPIRKVLGLSKIAERIEETFGEGKLLVIPKDDKNSLLFIGTDDVMSNVMDIINNYLDSYEEKKIEFRPDIYQQVKCEVQNISTSFDEDTLIIKSFTDHAKKGFIIMGITDICTDVFQRIDNLLITIPLSPLKLKYCQEFTHIIDEKFKEKQIQYWFDFARGVIVHNEDREMQKAKTLLDEIISEHCENIRTQPMTKLLGIEKAVEKIKNKLQDEKVLLSCNNEDLLVVGNRNIMTSVLEKIYKLIDNYDQRKVTLCNTARILQEIHQISVKYDRESLSIKQLATCETTVEYLITGVKVICKNVCENLENIFVKLSISHAKLAFLKSSVSAQEFVKKSLNDGGIEHILEIDPEVILHIDASKADQAKAIVNDIIIEQREDMSSYSIRRLYELDQISGEHEKKYENQLSVTASNNPDNAVKAIEFPARKREFLKYSQKAKTNIAFNLQKLNISVPNFDTEKLFLIGSEADKVMQVFDAVITEHRISISSEPLMKILGLTQIAKSIEEHFEKDNLLVFPNVTEDSLLLVGISDNMPHVLKQINNFFGKFEERQIAISRDLFKKKPNLVDEIENISFLYDTEVLKINPVSGCEPTVTFQIVGKTDDCTVVGGEIEKMFQSNPPNPLILVDTSIKKTKRDFSDQTEQCEQSETTVELFVPVNDLAVSKLSTDEGEALSSRIKKNNECDIEAHQISGIVTEEIYSWYSSNGFQVIAVKGKLWNMQADVLVYPVDEELRTVEGLIPSHFLAAGTFSESLRSFLNMEKNIKESSFKFVDVENKRILIVRMPKETTEKKNVLKCILRKTMNKHFCTLAFPSSVDVKHVIQSIRDFSCGRSCDSPQMVIYIMLNDDKDLTSLMAVFNKNWKKQDLRIQPISRISLAVGELVDQKADVLVNSTNKMLNLDHGNVSKSLKASAGKKLQEECTKHAPVRCGEVITTGTGDLKMNKAIFHGVLQPCVKEHPECYQVCFIL